MKRTGKNTYFDYNATSFMTRDTLVHMVDWCNRGNPSSGYASAMEVAAEMQNTRRAVAGLLHYRNSEDWIAERTKTAGHVGGNTMDAKNTPNMFGDSPDLPPVDLYRTIFTSGATESNATIIYMLCRAYTKNIGRPHIVISGVEHKSIIDAVQLVDADVTIVPPTPLGFVSVKAVIQAIKPNTAVISVQHANNETGCINNIAEIATLAHQRNIPFHTDIVQTFGRLPIDVVAMQLDAASVSFHKCAGPQGVGALIIRERLIRGWELTSVIPGSQQGGLRGGTENAPGIIAAGFALREYTRDRPAKNVRLLALKKRLIDRLCAETACKTLREYTECGANQRRFTDIVFISTLEPAYLPNTLLMSVIRWRRGGEVCNVDIKKALEADGFIVSIGSACNTTSKFASHVVHAMQLDEQIRKGVLRVSFGDENTEPEVDRFVKSIIAILR